MTTTLILVIVVLLVVLVALIVLAAWRASRTRRLRTRFGPEYDRVAADTPNRDTAENELRARERRHSELELRPLDRATRDRYAGEWAAVQERFVDTPARSLHDADLLVTDLMRERGYPVEDFGQQVSDLSVRHGHTLDHYRRAHAISTQVAETDAETTEEMRQAMVHYREMFADLLVDDTRADAHPGTREGRPDAAHEPAPTTPPGPTPGTAPGSAPGTVHPRDGVGAKLRGMLSSDHSGTTASRKDRP